MKITALVLAGGRGERFWPRSRRSFPKQFLCISNDGRTMIQLTIDRISSLVAYEDIFISTNSEYKDLAMEQLPEIPPENFLCEPVGRNTAPCIGLAAMHVKNKYEDALMITLPADHLIKYTAVFKKVLREACRIAEVDSNLVTVGIAPTYPETGYGYIKFDINEQIVNNTSAFAVEKFEEKPDLEKVKEYLASEEYLWNSGMFVWKASSILLNIKTHLPDSYAHLESIYDAIGSKNYNAVLLKEFTNMQPESIDYGVLEKAENIYILPGAFGWDDVGSWLSVGRIKKSDNRGNVITGNVIAVDSKNSIMECGGRLIATVGVRDLIIVDTEDATLICDKDYTPGIKQVIEQLKLSNQEQYI